MAQHCPKAWWNNPWYGSRISLFSENQRVLINRPLKNNRLDNQILWSMLYIEVYSAGNGSLRYFLFGYTPCLIETVRCGLWLCQDAGKKKRDLKRDLWETKALYSSALLYPSLLCTLFYSIQIFFTLLFSALLFPARSIRPCAQCSWRSETWLGGDFLEFTGLNHEDVDFNPNRSNHHKQIFLRHQRLVDFIRFHHHRREQKHQTTRGCIWIYIIHILLCIYYIYNM